MSNLTATDSLDPGTLADRNHCENGHHSFEVPNPLLANFLTLRNILEQNPAQEFKFSQGTNFKALFNTYLKIFRIYQIMTGMDVTDNNIPCNYVPTIDIFEDEEICGEKAQPLFSLKPCFSLPSLLMYLTQHRGENIHRSCCLRGMHHSLLVRIGQDGASPLYSL